MSKAWERITTAERARSRVDSCYLNVALTRTGLSRLGFSESVLTTFPTAFLDGMSSPNRSRILGDESDSAPENWLWGSTGKEVDAIVLIFARDQDTLQKAMQSEQAAMTGISLRIDPVLTQLWSDQREHFGFHDGISQPEIEGSPMLVDTSDTGGKPSDPNVADSNVIKAGEFLLGYLNEYGVLPDSIDMPLETDSGGVLPLMTMPDGSRAADLGHNGTYLVVRQVAQHVPQLWSYLDQATKDATGQSRCEEREKLGSKLIGRWPSGAPMTLTPERDDPGQSDANDFLYQNSDAQGFGCPYGAHIRRTNPRDTLGDDPVEALKLTKRHRLIRRGRSYGPRAENPLDLNDKHERGLVFMCINANIERQFEFVQQTWINNPSFNGLYDERDPIFGHSSTEPTGSMTIPRRPARRRLSGLGGFVTIRGGAYFFLPSIKALRYISGLR